MKRLYLSVIFINLSLSLLAQSLSEEEAAEKKLRQIAAGLIQGATAEARPKAA